ncbi:NAD+ synthase [Dechloromonas sp. ZS-1]|uniref:NAD+ synthase n=1 Tax=Dechloromonas sp. ZS-1 TaxID=3138067 RepID=UPI0031FCBF0A
MLRIAVAQFNATVGDLTGNVERILTCAAEAKARGAHLLLTPELALCGYPPEDLLLRPDFYRASQRALDDLAARAPLPVIVGHPEEHEGRCYNAASVLENGQKIAVYRKNRLPNYDVFDEQRYFAAGTEPCVVTLNGVRCGINICADIWAAGAAESARAAGAEVLLVLNASPLHLGKTRERVDALGQRVAATGIPAVYCNLVGGQDELVFDGGSFALDARGEVRMRLPSFDEAVGIVELGEAGTLYSSDLAEPLLTEAEAYRALVVGVRDYIGKSGFKGALIGLSGGIDSALTLCVAVDALGADKVHAVMMPSPYTAQMSLDDSREMIRQLGCTYDEIAIAPAMATYDTMLAPLFAGLPSDTTEENIQARIRGNILMALSNKTGKLVLTTGNKSEMAVGYCTLYGDMAGGFAVIKDVYKTLVYRLSRYRNSLCAGDPVIPENIIVRPPSAELKPDQKDQDSLPEYEVLDAIVKAYMEEDRSPREIIAAGLPEADVRRVVRLLRIAEYKRRQAPVGIRITPRGFGKDWRYPITNRYADEY